MAGSDAVNGGRAARNEHIGQARRTGRSQ